MPLAAITMRTLWQTTQFLAEYKVKVLRERGVVAIPVTLCEVKKYVVVFFLTSPISANFASFS
jgi:hypothetical protein